MSEDTIVMCVRNGFLEALPADWNKVHAPHAGGVPAHACVPQSAPDDDGRHFQPLLQSLLERSILDRQFRNLDSDCTSSKGTLKASTSGVTFIGIDSTPDLQDIPIPFRDH